MRSKQDENKSDSSKTKDNSKPVEPPKDYIHVRARRGQATDSHSLAERVSYLIFGNCNDMLTIIIFFNYNILICIDMLCVLNVSFRSVERRSVKEWSFFRILFRAVIRCLINYAYEYLKSTVITKTKLSIISKLRFYYLSQVTGKAVMLDEIINYVQSLQRQVEVKSNFHKFWIWPFSF